MSVRILVTFLAAAVATAACTVSPGSPSATTRPSVPVAQRDAEPKPHSDPLGVADRRADADPVAHDARGPRGHRPAGDGVPGWCGARVVPGGRFAIPSLHRAPRSGAGDRSGMAAHRAGRRLGRHVRDRSIHHLGGRRLDHSDRDELELPRHGVRRGESAGRRLSRAPRQAQRRDRPGADPDRAGRRAGHHPARLARVRWAPAMLQCLPGAHRPGRRVRRRPS